MSEPEAADGLAEFHAGDTRAIERCYRDYFVLVERAVGSVLSGADCETVIHEVFYRLLSDARLRSGFRGGSMAAWLTTVARHHAIDYVRRCRREQSLVHELGRDQLPSWSESNPAERWEQQATARDLVERFRRHHLPAKWAGVFETRFVQQLNQREAARQLGLHRTTLAYQEHQVRRLLRRFLLRGAEE